MDLDGTIQIYVAYRPHYHDYHECAANQTARFLPPNSFRRVSFLGGGDSMLLHEVNKYESLELVVGLDLTKTLPGDVSNISELKMMMEWSGGSEMMRPRVTHTYLGLFYYWLIYPKLS